MRLLRGKSSTSFVMWQAASFSNTEQVKCRMKGGWYRQKSYM